MVLIVLSLGNPDMAEAGSQLHRRYISHALQGQLSPLVGELTNADSNLSEEDSRLIEQFLARFGPDGQVEEPETDLPLVRDIVVTYREYWSDVLLHEYTKEECEGMITARVRRVLEEHGILCADTVSPLQKVVEEFEKRGYQALTGVTLPHFDLLAWGSNEAVDYKIQLTDDTMTVRVYFMRDFVSYGWSHYATFGVAYPGGWAGDNALYCMSKDYDRSGEKFVISYLKHEGRHFADYMRFPKLQQTDLEYRAKLTELAFADSTLYTLIERFSTNAARNGEAPHSLANHELISRLSRAIFDQDFVEDPDRWRSVDISRIHQEACRLLALSTQDLTEAGADTVQGLITP
jgi:hypothetical protein